MDYKKQVEKMVEELTEDQSRMLYAFIDQLIKHLDEAQEEAPSKES